MAKRSFHSRFGSGLPVWCHALESRLLLDGSALLSAVQTGVKLLQTQLGRDLAGVYSEYQSYRTATGHSTVFKPSNPLLHINNNRIAVEAISTRAPALATELQGLGMSSIFTDGNIVSGWLPLTQLALLPTLSDLGFVRPLRYTTHAGLVTSQGDIAQASNLARSVYGLDGTGVKVGIISDSFNVSSNGSMAADIASGDLPAGVTILQDGNTGDSDEGRAMAQIVHDVAPGASIAFHTGDGGQGNFAAGIYALANAGSKVIVDDLIYFDEPMFQDGIINQAVDSVVAAGVTYFSAAGNEARQAYQSPFRSSGITYSDGQIRSLLGAPAFGGGLAHDFDPGPGIDTFQSFTLGAGQTITLDFQWNQPYLSVGGNSGALTDMDIYVLNSSGTRVAAGSTASNPGNDPTELFQYTNSGSAATFNLMIVQWQDPNHVIPPGPLPTMMKYVDFNGSATNYQFATNSGTIYGHANAAGAEAVAASRYSQTPAYGVSPALVEYFSSAGSTPVYTYDASGNILTSVTRQKPEIAAPDGGLTTMAAPFANFYGTSAAAPHAAAVAALMLQAKPSLMPSQIRRALQDTALDMDDPSTAGFDTGVDYSTGYGLIQANAALRSVVSPVTVTGMTYVDVNGDGIRQGAETGISGFTPYIDGNGDTVLSNTQTTLSSNAVQTIAPLTTVSAPLAASTLNGLILDVNVKLSITDPNNADLEAYLISPGGSRIQLFTGLSGANLTNTIFDDQAAASISTGTAPYTGSFKPLAAAGLAAMDHQSPNGMWRLEIVNHSATNAGTLSNWALTFTYGDIPATPDSSGHYSIGNLEAQTVLTIRQLPRAGWFSTDAFSAYSDTLPPGSTAINTDFGNFPISFAGAGGDDNYTLRLNSAGTTLEIYQNITPGPAINPSYSIATGKLPSLAFSPDGGNDTLTVDFTNGNPIPHQVSFDGGLGTDTLVIIAGASSSPASFDSGQWLFGTTPITYSGLENVVYNGLPSGNVLDMTSSPTFASLTLQGGSFTLAAVGQATGAPGLTLSVAGGVTAAIDSDMALGWLSIANSAVVRVAVGIAKTLTLGGLSMAGTGKLDLTTNSMIFQSSAANRAGDAAALAALLGAGRAGGTWTGNGLYSSAAATAVPAITGLMMLINDNGAGQPIRTTFGSQSFSVGVNSILIRYTYSGDVDLNGVVNADDYFFIDSSLANHTPGYKNGDIDFSGAVDGDDYFFADRAFAAQGGPLAASTHPVALAQKVTAAAPAVVVVAKKPAGKARHRR